MPIKLVLRYFWEQYLQPFQLKTQNSDTTENYR